MPKGYTPDQRNAAAVADSPMAFVQIKATITIAGGAGAGTVNVFGPNEPDNTASAAAKLSSSPTQRRPGHRLAIYRITGGDTVAASGTRTAVIFTFSTLTVAPDGSTITVGGIISRANRVVNVSTVGGWALQPSEMITPFAPLVGIPLVIGDPDCGIRITTAANGDDSTMPIEILAKMIPTCIPGRI